MLRLSGRLVAAVGILINYLCVFSFLSGIACVLLGPTFPHFASNLCFPLSAPQDLATDKKGRIYVALGFYGRIQVYDRDGEFVYGFFTQTGGGPMRLQIDSNDHLRIAASRTDRLHIYDTNGRLLESRHNAKNSFEHLQRPRIVDGADNRVRYVVRNPLLKPEILKLDGKHNVLLRIDTPIWVWPLVCPLPCWLTLLIVYGLLSLMGYWDRRYWNNKIFGDVICAGSGYQNILIRDTDGERDVVLTSNKIYWSSDGQEPYACIRCDDAHVTIWVESVFRPVIRIASVSQPSVQVIFTPKRVTWWIKHLTKCGVQFQSRSLATGYVVVDDILRIAKAVVCVYFAFKIFFFVRRVIGGG